jgi:hypothetical protein
MPEPGNLHRPKRERISWRRLRKMPLQRYKLEQIVALLKQIEVSMANGKSTPQACKVAGITAQSYYRWRREYGG